MLEHGGRDALQNPDAQTVLIAGDAAWLYDTNGLHVNPRPKKLKIIVINNGGGNIFRWLKGPEETGLLEAHFEAGFATDVSASAQQLDLKYACAQDWESLEVAFAAWLNNDAPGLLEIQTPGAASAEFFGIQIDRDFRGHETHSNPRIPALNGSIQAFLLASRLRTLPLASACVMVGAAVAYPRVIAINESTGAFWRVFGLILLTVVLLQTLSNWANDLGDYENGADGADRTDRMVASGQLSLVVMKRAIVALGVLAFGCGFAAVGAAFWGTSLLVEVLAMVGLGVLAIGAAYRYTAGKNPYGYRGLGDLMVLVFFGWVGVGGTAFAGR